MAAAAPSFLWQTSPMFDDPHPSSLPPSSGTASALSFFVASKVLQIVHSLCKRAHSRHRLAAPLASKQRAKAKLQSCQSFELELEAYEKIDKYLGRKTSRRNERRTRYRRRLVAASTIDDLQKPRAFVDAESSLDLINRHSRSKSRRLTAIAQSDTLFLKRDAEFDLQPLSLDQLSQLVIVTRNLLETFNRTKHGKRVRTVCQRYKVLDADGTYVANLHHLLLCLYHQLLKLLIYRLVELAHKHLIESQKDQEKQWIDWFFEFPDARHPLNTTWPWSIRPSLAVIWGVCWMFFDPAVYRFDQYGNMVDHHGKMVVPRENMDMAEQYLRGLQAQRGAGRAVGDNIIGGGETQGQGRLGPDHVADRAGPRFTTHAHAHAHAQLADRSPGPGSSIARRGLGHPYTSPSTATAQDVHQWQALEASTSALGYQQPVTPAQASSDAPDAWAVGLEPIGTTRYLPPGPPQIQLQTADLSPFLQPQDNTHLSATSAISSTSSPYHNDEVFARGYNPCYNNHNNYSLRPHSPHLVPTTMEVAGPLHHAPVSPVSPRPHNHTDEQVISQLVHEITGGRKRSFEQMSSDAKPQMHLEHSHSRAVSVSSAPEGPSPAVEQGSPRGGSRSHKRHDPPTNSEGKYCCNYSNECSALTFDRKCEWSKHMDKHDRPYRCPDPLCAKLQGFTYSGGLLRHEREVHNKHGGPKEQLVCPILDCKRHSGKGFTRKENLLEHMRRVHENKTQNMQSPDASIQANLDALHGVDESAHFPAPQESSGMIGPDDLVDGPPYEKRKRMTEDDSMELPVNDFESLQHQLKLLRAENEEKDKRLRMLEAAETERRQELEGYKEALEQLRQSRDVQSLQNA